MTRRIRTLTIVLVALMLTPMIALAQTTLIASYSLDGTAVDGTGTHGPMELINAPFEEGGVYLNGNYVGSQPDSSHAGTPLIPSLDMGAFSILVDFKVAEYPSITKPVIIGGSGWRWGGGSLTSDGKLQIAYNNSSGATGDQVVSLDTWHTLIFTYDGSTGSLYLDGALVTTQDYTLVHGDDRDVSTSNGALGRSFKGHIRNLNIHNGVVDVVPVMPRSWGSIKAAGRSLPRR